MSNRYRIERRQPITEEPTRRRPRRVAAPIEQRPWPSLRNPFRSRRQLIVAASVVLLLSAVAYGIAMRGPSERTLAEGRELFVHEWQPGDVLAGGGDGLGPVFNARSCVECHFQGGIGGGGTNEHNVTSYEILPVGGRTEKISGVVHASAVSTDLQESVAWLKSEYPPADVPLPGDCNIPVTRTVDPVLLTSINTPPLFGLGLMDDVSGWTLRGHEIVGTVSQIEREFALDFDSTPIGRPRKLEDGRLGKFGWKGQFATLEEFVAAACAVELGLSNPHRKQTIPRTADEDVDAELDMTRSEFNALVAFVRDLPRPEQEWPEDSLERLRAEKGEELFASIGCADCHTPELGGIEGFYSNLMLHRLTDSPDDVAYGVLVPEAGTGPEPLPDEWKTPPLWGVADSAPYFHDGGSPTLRDAIRRHRGQAAEVTQRFEELQEGERDAVIAFLETLRAPRELREAARIDANGASLGHASR